MPQEDRRTAAVNFERRRRTKSGIESTEPTSNQMCAKSASSEKKSTHSFLPPSPIRSSSQGREGGWKGEKTQANRRSSSRDSANDSTSDQGEVWQYVDLKTGDCVLLDSGIPNEHYVALVNSVKLPSDRRKPGSFLAQWYYKPKDIKKEVRETIEGGILENEVFLSPHKDKNCLDAVIGSCYIVSPAEYETIKSEIDRGFREKGKTYFVCRYMYYPNRATNKNALEPIQGLPDLEEVYTRTGEEYQASIPDLVGKKDDTSTPHSKTCLLPKNGEKCLSSSAKQASSAMEHSLIQVWCPNVLTLHAGNLLHYRGLVDLIRFSIGNIVKIFHKGPTSMGHVRCLVLRYYAHQATIELCTSRGEIRKVLKSESCSPVTDDIALQYFYLNRFNISLAVKMCTELLWESQPLERDAFKGELGLFTQSIRNGAQNSNRTRPSRKADTGNALQRSQVTCLGVRKR
ncbi:unnamed protein product [Albugo candida]|uniref:BAH domain-containing protein n=1 Tax=Albugo candida TaxID=65357 RepID=A0A024GLG7_9STRA|nr:unnamed protein product [Albugo candida]|eukprot:CCI47350.1 unnamed protein product [Albugo candida]